MPAPFDDLAKRVYGDSINEFARGNDYLEKHAMEVCYPAIAALRVPEEYAALVLTARMDTELRKLIVNAAHRQGDAEELMFNSLNAPLSSFSAKISLAFFAGFITEKMFAAITCCRRIRNAYAHNENPLDARNDKKYTKNRTKLLELDAAFTTNCIEKMERLCDNARQHDDNVSTRSPVTAIMVEISDNLGTAAFFSMHARSIQKPSVIPAFYGPTDIPEIGSP